MVTEAFKLRRRLMMATTKKLANTTKKLFRELSKGKELTQAQIGNMLWKVAHKGEDAPAYVSSYWHSSLLRLVTQKKISKKKMPDGKIVYRITQLGRKYALMQGIIK